jgi:voltage-gated potassium channel
MEEFMLRELLIAFAIVAVCVVIHAGGIAVFAQFLSRKFPPEQLVALNRQVLVLIIVFAMVITLHLIETSIWAMFYFWNNHFPDYETALYFSLGTYSTIGYGDVVLPQRWRLLGGIEGISGVLLCGLSGAFIFAVVNVLYQTRLQQRAGRKEAQRAQTI